MFRNYFIAAWRNLLHHKAYSFINIFGLSIGMTCSIYILLWVNNEYSYDRFHANADKTYRVVCDAGDVKYALSSAPIAPAMKSRMTGVHNVVRVTLPRTHLFQAGQKKFEEKRILYADSTFLEIFSFPLLTGNAVTALTNPNAILITQHMAEKYYGSVDVVGKVLQKDDGENVIVQGVLENIPSVSHLQFDAVMPLSSIAHSEKDVKNNVWDHLNYYTYVQADKHLNSEKITHFNELLNKIFQQHVPETHIKFLFSLQPLLDIHLHSGYQFDVAGNGNVQYTNIFIVVAMFIFSVACINYMNLATARSARRAKEVGLRKVVGANRRQLIVQFFGEAVFIGFLASLLAIGAVYLFLPLFNSLVGKQIDFRPLQAQWLPTLLVMALLCGLLSGIYPALLLSRVAPLTVLKSAQGFRSTKSVFRNVLVVTQFAVSIFLLVATFVFYQQLEYVRQKNLGFNQSNLLYFQMKGSMWEKQTALRRELQKNPLTVNFTIVDDVPLDLAGGTSDVEWSGKDHSKQTMFAVMAVSEDFFRVMQMAIVDGRSFSSKSIADSGNYIVNESALKAMGISAATVIGKELTLSNTKGTIIGVVKDFNYQPMQHLIQPMIITLNRWGGIVLVRALPGRTEPTIAALASMHASLTPEYPFSYDFLDQNIANLYQADKRMGDLFNALAGIAIIISGLGLYGLSAFTAEQQSKEIAIRKVLGATVPKLVMISLAGITRLILIAAIIAIPVACWLVSTWLENFAYRIEVNWVTLAGAVVSTVLMGWLTIIYESLKAALATPANILRGK